MTVSLIARNAAPIILIATFAPVGAALAATSESQAWITEQFAFKADKATTITLDASQRARSDRTSGGEQFLERVSIDRRIAPGVEIGGGFAYVRGESEKELRFHQQLTLTRGLFSSRTRLEQRFFDNADEASWRLRERIAVTVPLDHARRTNLIATNELFFHLNRARPSDKTGLAMMRQQIGLRQRLSPQIDAQLLYMRQQTFRDHRPDAVAHIPWATLSFRL